jgi:uncharacterized repeat protein (TIGR03803 family)
VYRLVPPTIPGTLGVGSVIYSFAGGNDGATPLDRLIADTLGNFFGTTYYGGTGGFGTVFEVSPPATQGGAWTETVLYSFTNTGDGAYPRASLEKCGAGLCGTTGGVYGTAGDYGTVFMLLPPSRKLPHWQFSVLYSFGGGNDGSAPFGRLLRLGDKSLIGTASGYLAGTGNVFRLTPPALAGGAWGSEVLHDFPFGSDGYTPLGGTVSDPAGILYGTTTGGGAQNSGTVYRLIPQTSAPNGYSEQVVTSLPSPSAPQGEPIIGPYGLLYYTTLSGGVNGFGSIETLDRNEKSLPWVPVILHSFAGGADGDTPYGGFSHGVGNVLYGTTSGGNDSSGTVFVLSP